MLNYQRIIYRRYMEVPSWLVTYRSRQVPFLLSKAWLTGASHYTNDPPVLSNNRNGKVPSYRSAWWYTYPSENMKVRLDHHPNYWGKYQVFQSPPTSIFGLRPPCVGDLLAMLDGTGGYPQWFFSGSSSMGIWVLEGIAYLQYSMNIPVIFHSWSIHIPFIFHLWSSFTQSIQFIDGYSWYVQGLSAVSDTVNTYPKGASSTPSQLPVESIPSGTEFVA